jgi:hypothetical protein
MLGKEQPLSHEGDDVLVSSQPAEEASIDSPLIISPQQIDWAIQDQGAELHELLQMFKDASTEPLASFVLQTPKHKIVLPTDHVPKSSSLGTDTRCSPWLKGKMPKGKSIIKMAHEMVAKKCGIVQDE